MGILVFLGIAAVLFLVAWISVSHLPQVRGFAWRDRLGEVPWLRGWSHWDAGWYDRIADRGYDLRGSGRQSPAAFFPAYPLLMRLAASVVRSRLVGGILITMASGAATAGLFALWLRDKVEAPARWTALLLFLLYPFAFYVYGAVYADALFIAAVLATFLLLERDLPLWAGVAGAVATATRPVGAALLLPLVIRAIERRGGIRNVQWRDAGVLLAGAGVGAFCLFLWSRYGTPLAFVEAQRGWNQEPGVETWLKLGFFRDLRAFVDGPSDAVVFLSHPVLTVCALALVPSVVRRWGWGYGSYVLVVAGVSALFTRNFFGMSRYLLAAFPCFAVAGVLLARRPWVRNVGLACSAVLLVGATSLYARGFYIS